MTINWLIGKTTEGIGKRPSLFLNDSMTRLAAQAGCVAMKQLQRVGSTVKIAINIHAGVAPPSGKRQPGHFAGLGVTKLHTAIVVMRMHTFVAAAIRFTFATKSASKFGYSGSAATDPSLFEVLLIATRDSAGPANGDASPDPAR